MKTTAQQIAELIHANQPVPESMRERNIRENGQYSAWAVRAALDSIQTNPAGWDRIEA